MKGNFCYWAEADIGKPSSNGGRKGLGEYGRKPCIALRTELLGLTYLINELEGLYSVLPVSSFLTQVSLA